jgi:hypothetical protein
VFAIPSLSGGYCIMAAVGVYVESTTVVLIGGWVYAKADSEMDVTGLEKARGLGWPVVPEAVLVDGQPYVLQLRFGQQDPDMSTAVPTQADHLAAKHSADTEEGGYVSLVAKPRPTRAPPDGVRSIVSAGKIAPSTSPKEVKKLLKAKAKTPARGAALGGRQQTLVECGIGSGSSSHPALLPIGAKQHRGPAVPPIMQAQSLLGAARPKRKPRVVAAQKHPLRAHLGRKYSAIMGIGAGRLHTLG